jgi:hypothetical protein
VEGEDETAGSLGRRRQQQEPLLYLPPGGEEERVVRAHVVKADAPEPLEV